MKVVIVSLVMKIKKLGARLVRFFLKEVRNVQREWDEWLLARRTCRRLVGACRAGRRGRGRSGRGSRRRRRSFALYW